MPHALRSMLAAAARMVPGVAALHRGRARQRMLRHHPTVRFEEDVHLTDATLGQHLRLGRGTWVYRATIGDYSYTSHNVRVSEASIGKFCSIAAEAWIGVPQHPVREYVSTHPIFAEHSPEVGLDFVPKTLFDAYRRTTLGHDVWVGTGALLMTGVTIGNGAVIGAGAVVTKDVEPYAIYVGVPARRVRYRFEPDVIAAIEASAWWDRDEAWLRKNASQFADVNGFVRAITEKRI